MSQVQKISGCRLCGNQSLQPVLDVGEICFTGRFPEADQQDPPIAPLELMRCEKCQLVQLNHSYPGDEMFGETYGYRSSITETMKTHLREISETAKSWVGDKNQISVLDIGSNDGTLLGFFQGDNTKLMGIDPCAKKHQDNYPAGSRIVNDFFNAANVRSAVGDEKFDVITSIAMFYDIDRPVDFAADISSLLSKDGIWITEQTHSHTLLESTCYDSICHEHVTYLSLKAMEEICERTGLRIIDIKMNEINGGSFAAVITKRDSKLEANITNITNFLKIENELNMEDSAVWDKFRSDVEKHKKGLQELFREFKKNNKKVFGYGASTKGNVVLNYCGLGRDEVPYVLERDPLKYGKVTPGTRIPIISEEEGRAKNPDVLLVLPWHFRDEIIKREQEFLERDGTLLFPLPKIELVTKDSIKEW